MPLVGDLVDRYVIEEEIGAGGMGRVYRALDPRLGRRVALKVLLADGSEASRAEAAARMLREARAAAAFTHPNVVAIHDVGEADGSPFIAMELVRGRTLRAEVGGGSSPQEKLGWLRDVARGLAAAHRAGLVHRDIKPDNVMITTDGVLKILDFGIARSAESAPSDVDAAAQTAAASLPTLTAEGQSLGTPQYMAPEQLRAEPLDGRCDQFAWGVMAWELFVGTPPWVAARTAAQVVACVLATPARPLVEVLPGVSPTVSDVVARTLSKDRAARFATMDDVLAALDGAAPRASAPPEPREVDEAAIAKTVADVATTPPERPARGIAEVAQTGLRARAGLPVTRLGRALATVLALGGVVIAAQALRGGSLGSLFGHGPKPAQRPDSDEDDDDALVGPCDKPEQAACGAGTKAWCDVRGRKVACCERGLVAVGTDGLCDCPPGGGDGTTGKCWRGAPSIPGVDSAVAGLRPALRECFGEEGPTEATLGRIVVSFHIVGDGRVRRVHIDEGHVASPAVQRCALEVLRRARFAPPPGGDVTLRVPIVLSSVPSHGDAGVL